MTNIPVITITMSYKKFILMIVLSFIAMYILMYAMVDRVAIGER